MEVLQVVPRLPPAIDGVGDYSLLLAQELRRAHGINTRFVVSDPGWKAGAVSLTIDQGTMSVDGFPVYQLRERSAAELLRLLNGPEMPQTVLLQYVGYGYEKRGCPVWLVRGLDKWRKQKTESRKQTGISQFQLSAFSVSPRPRLITMFHELYAFGPPWRSSSWTSPIQRWIAKSVAQLSDHSVTNLARNVPVLCRMTGRHPEDFSLLPVFSNVGEPETLPQWSERKPQLLIYGGLSRKNSDFQFAAAVLRNACETFQIKSVIAFGKKSVGFEFGLAVKNLGVLEPPEISAVMLESRIGYLDYFDGYLAKSGIFAAYCAHGLAPLLLHNNHSGADGLEPNKHYFVAASLTKAGRVADQKRIGAQAHQWYRTHSQRVVGGAVAQKLFANDVALPLET